MLKLSASLGLKYFRSSKGAFVSFTSIMAIMGLTIGVAALIIVTSVMNGFEKELENRILGVIPHSVIYADTPIDNNPIIPENMPALLFLLTAIAIKTQNKGSETLAI